MSAQLHPSYERTERRDRWISLVLALLLWGGVLAFLFWYKIKIWQTAPVEKQEVSAMLINFGDGTNGSGLEEPAPQEGSTASMVENTFQEETPAKNTVPVAPTPTPPVLTGLDKNRSTTKTDANRPNKTATKTPASSPSRASKSSSTKQSGAGSGDGRGNAAIGNFINGKGTATGSQGTGSGNGNAGDPLGGSGNGDSKIGIDRKLVGFIPGTMGRGGAQPEHSCKANGTITIAYTVDKNGSVTAARRVSGLSDPCVVSTSIGWVKKYVRAERANVSSTGSYKITF